MSESPCFQFYPRDFLADENQMVMELAEAGAYIRLICVCWREGSIPSDLRKMAKCCGATLREIQAAWPALEPCFTPHPTEPGRLVHHRLEKEREIQRAWREKSARGGKRSALVRKGGSTVVQPPLVPPLVPNGQPKANTVVRSSQSAFNSKEVPARAREPEPQAPTPEQRQEGLRAFREALQGPGVT